MFPLTLPCRVTRDTRDRENGDVQRVNCSSFCVEITRPPPSVPPGFHRRGDPRAHNVQLARPSLFQRPRKRRRSFPPSVSPRIAWTRVRDDLSSCTMHIAHIYTRTADTSESNNEAPVAFLCLLRSNSFAWTSISCIPGESTTEIIGEHRITIFLLSELI
jgi:hypothetical protein